ncbi:cation diffusion facilitator family transporter [Sphingomonas sp.]|jgi:cobalt-zinc-cadmium efflux system protein|uniref:cation diffusion facilitator family transporter n=1 Tax=Sphingomonas sp. TaxID=28214 RepID=UPI002D8066C7|nr:cation diffusion facilitator family transporter [Sphingomonas sp.]HEU0043319.1 cation diffusion facilitator family transporter [Sphingomonas sp.]
MGHGHHHHGHDHGHAHGPTSFDRAFAFGIGLNLLYVIAEASAGLWWGSVALLADAGHNLSDVAGLGVAWAGAVLARRPATKRFTYGFKSSTILAAMMNSLLLMVALGAVVLEATRRLGEPAPLVGGEIAAVAAVGIAVNGFTAWLFARGRHGDVNIRGAYLHMLSDAAVSAGVVVAGLLIWWTGFGWIDPLVSLAIAGIIFWQTAGLLRETVEMALQAVPRDLDYDKVRMALRVLPGVERVHDLHIWPMSTTEPVLTAHLVMPGGVPDDAFLRSAQAMLREKYGIGHATLQVERGDEGRC